MELLYRSLFRLVWMTRRNATYYDPDDRASEEGGFDLIYDTSSLHRRHLHCVTPELVLQTWVKFNGDYTDSSGYTDWQAVGSPSFISGLWGRQSIAVYDWWQRCKGQDQLERVRHSRMVVDVLVQDIGDGRLSFVLKVLRHQGGMVHPEA